MPGISLIVAEGRILPHYGYGGGEGEKRVLVGRELPDDAKQIVLKALSEKGVKDHYGGALDESFSFDDDGYLYVGKNKVPEDQLAALVVDIKI